MAQTQIENLALHFQEVLTAIVRLRANRQTVSDAESFRHPPPQGADGMITCGGRLGQR